MAWEMNNQCCEVLGQVTGSCEFSYDNKQKTHRRSSGSHESSQISERAKLGRVNRKSLKESQHRASMVLTLDYFI